MTEAERSFGDNNGNHEPSWFRRNARWLRLAAFALVVAAALFSTVRTFDLAQQNKTAIAKIKANQVKIERETKERRHQVCLSAEREHLRAVEQLESTYRYIVKLPEAELATALNQTILLQLPQTEARARVDVAPEFCDAPGEKAERLYKQTDGKEGAEPTGLPEPDPVVPKRPQKVDELFKTAQKGAREEAREQVRQMRQK